MKTSSQQDETIVPVVILLVLSVSPAGFDCATERITNELSGCHDTGALVRNVILHAGVGVDRQLASLVDRPSKAAIVLASVISFSIWEYISSVRGLFQVEFRLTSSGVVNLKSG